MLKHALALFVLAALAVPAHAEPATDAKALAESMSWLIGTWEGTGPAEASADSKTQISFEWAAGEKVILWEGSYAVQEGTWSFLATFFYDPVKERSRVFAFNSNGRRHLGVLTQYETGKATWRLSGLREDGQLERFTLVFERGDDGLLHFTMKDRRPSDEGGSGDVTMKLRRTGGSG